MNEIKALFFAKYLWQRVFKGPGAYVYILMPAFLEFNISDDCFLSLRTVDMLTDDEKETIGQHMQWYPEDVIDWINGECGHQDFENLHDWLSCHDILRQLGILLPFTYLDENKKPITVQPGDNLKGMG